MAPYDFSAPRLYVRSDLHPDAVLVLDGPQRNYLCNVLRLKEGNDVLVFNGRDGEWRARLAAGGGRKQVVLAAAERTRAQGAAGDLHYLFAPLKHARLDYMVQKAVEMGVSALRPVITRRTQVARVNADRMAANAIEAAEQCGILALPSLHEVMPLDAALAGWDAGRVLVFCDEEVGPADPFDRLRGIGRDPGHDFGRGLTRGTPCAVLIGPEGGFEPAERAALLALPQVVRLSLGPRILRADTAAVAALALVQSALGDWRIGPDIGSGPIG